MLLPRANIRGKVSRSVLAGVNIAETDIFDFSYLSPGDILMGSMAYHANSIDGAIQSVGARIITQIINAAGTAFETATADGYAEGAVGVNPMLPDYAAVAGNLLALTFGFNNISAVTMVGVVNYSFSITRV